MYAGHLLLLAAIAGSGVHGAKGIPGVEKLQRQGMQTRHIPRAAQSTVQIEQPTTQASRVEHRGLKSIIRKRHTCVLTPQFTCVCMEVVPCCCCRWPGFLVPEHERRMGVVYEGDHSRLRAALERHRVTGNLTVVVVGGSISAGAGGVDNHA
jgi:hypothetical protein